MKLTLRYNLTAMNSESVVRTTLKAGTYFANRIQNPLGLRDNWIVTSEGIGFPELLCIILGQEAIVIEE